MTSQPTISQRLHERLGWILSSTPTGARLPSEPELARQLGVSRATLREAMRIFETKGWIIRRQGVGTFVQHPASVIETGLEVLESIETLAQRIGLTVTMGEWSGNRRPCTAEEAEALGLAPGQGVVYVSRVILAEGRPVAFLEDILPEEVISQEEVIANFTGSMLDLLLRRGYPTLTDSRCEIGAVAASAEIARALRIQRGDALLRFVSRLYAREGLVVDYSLSYFLPGYFRFHVVRKLG